MQRIFDPLRHSPEGKTWPLITARFDAETGQFGRLPKPSESGANRRIKLLDEMVRSHVQLGAEVFTDALKSS